MNQATLYIVATPIGHLADITFRAIEVLKSADLIAAEDTRHSRTLLNHYHIGTPMLSLHGDNEVAKTTQLIEKLSAGQSIALISDAGTPLISDPGEYLVKTVRAAGYAVVPIPGACAFVTALCAAGLSTQRILFEGFLPHKGKGRRQRLEALQPEAATLVFYESCHRIQSFVELAADVFGTQRDIVLARELTKQYETIFHGSIASALAWLQLDDYHRRGEFVVLIAGLKEAVEQVEVSPQRVMSVLSKALPTKQAAKLIAEITEQPARDIYQRILKDKNKESDQ